MKTDTDYPQLIQRFIDQEKLPQAYLEDALAWFLPLKDRLLAQCRNHPNKLQVIGINGAQGTGKSTFAALMNRLLSHEGLNVVNLSLDDFYHSHSKRQEMAANWHPLFASRGVPGTHNVQLLFDTLETLKTLTDIEKLVLPSFDKSTDDPYPADECPSIYGPVDILLLEGWFLGVEHEPNEALKTAINDLEEKEDSDGLWRLHVNTELSGDYQGLFAALDYFILLKAPSFEQVYEWRTLQEHKLRERSKEGSGTMTDEELVRFIQHFERLTRHCLATLPKKADVVFDLDVNHRITSASHF